MTPDFGLPTYLPDQAYYGALAAFAVLVCVVLYRCRTRSWSSTSETAMSPLRRSTKVSPLTSSSPGTTKRRGRGGRPRSSTASHSYGRGRTAVPVIPTASDEDWVPLKESEFTYEAATGGPSRRERDAATASGNARERSRNSTSEQAQSPESPGTPVSTRSSFSSSSAQESSSSTLSTPTDAPERARLKVQRHFVFDCKRPRDFPSLIQQGWYFVDKTMLLKDFIDFNGRVSLIPRPSGFGKSTNLSMMYYFFTTSQTASERKWRRELYKDFEFYKEYSELFEKYYCKYPVIFLDFKDARATKWSDLLDKLQRMISQMYAQYAYLLSRLGQNRDLFERIRDCDRTVAVKEWETALKNLSTYLFKHHEKPCIVLIDEFETTLRDAEYHGFFPEAHKFLKNMFTELFKNNAYMDKAMIVGTEWTRKMQIFPENAWEYALPSRDAIFQDKFGFTQEEIRVLVTELGINNEHDVKTILTGSSYNRVGFGRSPRTMIHNASRVWNELYKILEPRRRSS